MSKTSSALLGLLAAAAIVIFAIIAASLGFSWFSQTGAGVTANGMSVSAKSGLEIWAEESGPNIGVDEPTRDMPRLTLEVNTSGNTEGADSSSRSISPGSYGSFTFYVHNPAGGRHTFRCDFAIVNNEFADGNEGYYPDAIEENKPLARKFANSHIMMFRERSENGVYSGWINPEEGLTVENASVTQQVTVYWVWVPFNDYIFTGWELLNEADRRRIESYYTQESNQEKIYTTTKSGAVKRGSTGYNEADFIFGTTLKRICFDICVQEV